MIDDDRRFRDEAMEAHDRMMAEHAEAEGRRNTARVLLARKSGPGGVLHAAPVDNALAPAPEPGAEPLDPVSKLNAQNWERWLFSHLARERREIAEAIADIAADLQEQWRQDIHRHIGMMKDQGRTIHNVYARVDQRMKEFHSEVEFIVQNEQQQYEHRADAMRHKLRAENVELRNKLDAVLKRLEQSDATVKALAAELESERKDREALITSFETRFAGLHGLVRGLAGDWNAMS
jgi:signal transduction histidine kinase